ncbi:MAG: tetratricopeptide repeat protein [Ferruginibacter sp.]
MRLKLYFIFFLCLCFSAVLAQKSLIDSLEKIIALQRNDIKEGRALNTLAVEYTRTDLAKSKKLLFAAITLGKNLQHPITLSAAYAQLVTISQNMGNLDSAAYYLNALKHVTEGATGADAGILMANYYSTAGLYYKKTGNVKEALPFFKQAIVASEKIGNKTATAGQALNLGNTYLDLGNYKSALQFHLKALQLFEELGNKKGQSFCYQGIANSFAELNQFEQALVYSKKAIILKTELNDRRGLGTAQSGLGHIYLGLKNYDRALMHFTTALSIGQELNLVTEQAAMNFNIGKTYAAKKDVKNAVEFFKQSKTQAKQIGDSATSTAVDVELIALQQNASREIASEKKMFSSLKTFKEMGDVTKEVTGFKHMAEFYIKRNDFDKALAYTNRYHDLNDSIQNKDLKLQVRRMEEQFNAEKKEKEIGILKKDQQLNQQQLKQQQFFLLTAGIIILLILAGIWMMVNRYRLQQKMKELTLRNHIAADLHDEVGSSLSSIHMLSQMARDQKMNINEDILKKISTNAHETMEKMSDIVWMIKPTENDGVGLKERMQQFIYDLCSSLNINCTFKADDLDTLKLTMEQKKNMYLIFKEAINNAIKYSGTSILNVMIKLNQKNLVMHIKDYGKGFNENIVLKGNGLENMQIRAKELKGQLLITSQPEQGTELNLTFPV